ncbi:deleted in lung and esophageal cancer protein 1 isoform X2 [Cynoglossus semilaevis]|uniref:DLEC1 cilia and flagella associated protein n=1 Tax=Cynoglossus semilaevis TaxID=244447 RepID=A0A3P8WK22_CYNSE|nr:deleted in lung and esophageal cancer protein 1 isoform X2 [Cynoglossus semilaevis]
MATPISALMEKQELRARWMFEPSVNSHRPASAKSQDISYIFANTFKKIYTQDVIGKDTLANLVKTKSGRSSFHAKYVEELQRVHSEYDSQIQEADMLENHIIQARAQAAVKESQACERSRGDICDDKGLLTVQSAFSWCVDNDLLKMNNLICPRDYIPSLKTPCPAPSPVKLDPAKPTLCYSMHVSKEPRDDGYLLVHSPDRDDVDLNEVDNAMMVSSSSVTLKKRALHKEKQDEVKPKPSWKGQPSVKDKMEAWEKLKKMKDRQNILCNPHFLPPIAQPGGKSLIQPMTRVATTEREGRDMDGQSSTEDGVPVFIANPPVVVFAEYTVGQVYETTLELKNMTSASRHVRVIPPTTPHFSIGLGRFPGEGGVVAPGMSCKYAIRFAPDSLADYSDFIVVETQSEHQLVVPVLGRRPPPILTLPRVLDCGYCLIGGVKFVEFLCQNVGLSAGTFTIMPKNQWPTTNLRSVTKTYSSEEPPFAISPSLFALQPGEATVVEVVFFPTAAERISKDFTIICDNCQVKDISIEGEGQLIALELVSVSGENELPVIGEVHDLTAQHCVRFSSCNPHSVQQKKITIRNNVHVELPFHWEIMKPNLHLRLPEETPVPSNIQFHPAVDDAFSVSPVSGLLAPHQDMELLFTFRPKELRDYHSVCHLVLKDVPQLPQQDSGTSVPQPAHTGSKLSDFIAMQIEVMGSTEPYQVHLEPYALVIPGDIFICTTTRRQFKMWNKSKNFVRFQWERIDCSSHIIEVQPPTGRIGENECFNFDLIVTGGKPGKVVTSLVCHIQHHSEPVSLFFEVSFKGPTVTINAPSVDFGLIQVGDKVHKTLLLSNTSHLDTSWTIMGVKGREDASEVSVKPYEGVLPPFASCSVDVTFSSHYCQHFETNLELNVKNGTGCHLSVRADVQSPQVCLLSCELIFSELYVEIPTKGTVKLFNQTLLPSHFKWMAQLQGKQASLCTTSFDPPSGTLGPNACIEVTVNFTAHTDMKLTEVAALCEVQGMNSPLVLRILVPDPRTLSVSYLLPDVSSAQDTGRPSTLQLDFGQDVILKKPVMKQIMITNQTAIPAPFTIEAEYFTCPASTPQKHKELLENRFAYVKKPRHSIQAKKVDDKAHEDFVNTLLAHGKGAAFYVLPNSGTLAAFETKTVEVTAYTDMWGEYRDHLICKVGDLEPQLISIQMTVKGCPLYFQMTGPRTDDQNQGPIIQFGRHVSGADTVSRSLRINNPTLTDIRVDWEIYNIDPLSTKVLDVLVTYGEAFPLKDADGNEVMAEALSFSDGDVQTPWQRNSDYERTSFSRQTQSDSDEEGSNAIEESDTTEESFDTFPDEENLISVHIRPHVGNRSDYPFCITPQQLVIPAQGSSMIHVSFTPLTLCGNVCESKCEGLALGFMSLDSKSAACLPGKVRRAQGLDLEPLRLDLIAAVKPAGLLVQMDEDDGVLDFYASAGDLLRAESEKEVCVQDFDVTRTLQLLNSSEMIVHFKLKTQPPFMVIKPNPRVRSSTSSNSRSAESEFLVLQQQKSVQVKLAFRCSLSLLDHMAQVDKGVLPGVRLIQHVSGERSLRFEQNLLIQYINNSLQTVPLRANLTIPTLRLSKEHIDFGFCYVGRTRTIEVNLYCCGAHTYWKSVVESYGRDPDVFTVTPPSGLLRPKEPNVNTCSLCLEINFTPREDREFRATVLIQSPLLKNPLSMQVHGAGCFDEAYIAT